tara:strand:+ start:409 stop:792 length:384 start_codon:yes stop_codon:yes gene_type:complete
MKQEEKKVAIPFEIFIGICADVRSAKDIAAFHLEYEVEKNPALTWDTTSVPLLCDYYSCLSALQMLLEDTILSEDAITDAVERALTDDKESAIIVPLGELQTVRLLMEQAQVMKTGLSSSGLSMELH